MTITTSITSRRKTGNNEKERESGAKMNGEKRDRQIKPVVGRCKREKNLECLSIGAVFFCCVSNTKRKQNDDLLNNVDVCLNGSVT